jgi:YD repeat-containing protein
MLNFGVHKPMLTTAALLVGSMSNASAQSSSQCFQWEAHLSNGPAVLATGFGNSQMQAAQAATDGMNSWIPQNEGVCSGTKNLADSPTVTNEQYGTWNDVRYNPVWLGDVDANGNRIYVCVGPTLAYVNTIVFYSHPIACPAPPVASAPNMCLADAGASVGHPILPATAEKFRSETDFEDHAPAPLNFVRTYRSTWGLDAARATGPLGKTWAHNYSTNLQALPMGAPTQVVIQRPEGQQDAFTKPSGSSVWSAADRSDTLAQNADGTWSWRRAEEDATYTFSATGQLQTHTARNGWTTRYTYNALAQLATITNAFGRSLVLTYNAAGQLSTLTTPDANVLTYAYDTTARLASVTYPGNQTRSFLYENPAFAHALTGIVNEAGVRFATFAYDANGRAISTQLAGAADHYQVSYPAEGRANVVDPLGTSRSYSYGIAKNQLAVLSADKPAEDASQDAASRVQDANGLITSETDFKGSITSRTWDTSRRVPTSVTRASGTPESQAVQMQWHAVWRLPVLITESGRTTAFAYDGLGNPLSQTVTDTSVSPPQIQTTRWTYTAQSLVATETAPNGGVTTYGYDNAGNRTSVRNAQGQVTSYTYDGAGRVTRETSPTGLVTTYAYDPRGRLLAQSRGAMQAAFTYTPSGHLATASLPSGEALAYQYDAAQRRIGRSDGRGAVSAYNLDAMGNPTVERVKDSSGSITRSLARSIDTLNRKSSDAIGGN